MNETKILHILRNPYGFSDEEIRKARLMAANLIEEQKKDYQSLKDWAESNGLDVTTYG